jgi:hypothetical protein
VQELEITWRRVIAITWLITWRGLIVWFIAQFWIGLALSPILAMVSTSNDLTLDQASQVLRIPWNILRFSLMVIWMTAVVRMALRKQFDDFRLALVPIDNR